MLEAACSDLGATSADRMLHWTDRLAELCLHADAGTASAEAGSATYTNICQTRVQAPGNLLPIAGPPQAAAMVRTLGGGFLLPVAVFTYSLKVGRLSRLSQLSTDAFP